MENVSKALIIAGGVLIALLVVTLLVFGLSRLRKYQNTQISAKKNEQITEFNSQFESYNKQVITGYELISIGNMTEDTNRRYITEEGYKEVSTYVKAKNDNDKTNYSNCILDEFITKYDKVGEYYNLVEFSNYFNTLSDNVREQYNQKRKLKEAYFKCDSIKYDDKVDTSKGLTASGRVIEMKFSEITKKNN